MIRRCGSRYDAQAGMGTTGKGQGSQICFIHQTPELSTAFQ
jgi:hypothetical protein